MNYYIGEFNFDSEKLCLYKNERFCELRVNDAKVLALLLSDTSKIFSKDDILSEVWVGKVVSEQAVFQSISQLRNYFGSDAISTYSKRGYQWNIPLKKSESTQRPVSGGTHSSVSPSVNKNAAVVAVLMIFLSVLLLYLWQQKHADNIDQRYRISVLPLNIKGAPNDPTNTLIDILNGSDNIYAIKSNEEIPSLFYKHSPQKYFKLITDKTKSEFILSGQYSFTGKQHAFDYRLQGVTNAWHGRISGKDQQNTIYKAIKHIEKVIGSEILKQQTRDPKLMAAQVHILQQQYSDDLIILDYLIGLNIQTNALEHASALAKDLHKKAKEQNSLFYMASAEQALGLIYRLQDIPQKSLDYLNSALTRYTTLDSKARKIEVLRGLGHNYFNLEGYIKFKNIFEQAIEIAQMINDPITEVKLMTSISVMANKADEFNDRDRMLSEAILLLDRKQLPKEYYSPVYFYAGLYAEEAKVDMAEQYYHQVLNLYKTEQEAWLKERAQFHLSHVLIRQQRWQDALAIFADETELNAVENTLLAEIYFAKSNVKQARKFAEEAFRIASLKANKNAGLDAALLLAKIAEDSRDQEEKLIYTSYINKNANEFWLKQNQQALETLNPESTVVKE